MLRKPSLVLASLFVFAAVVAACSSDDSKSADAAAAESGSSSDAATEGGLDSGIGDGGGGQPDGELGCVSAGFKCIVLDGGACPNGGGPNSAPCQDFSQTCCR